MAKLDGEPMAKHKSRERERQWKNDQEADVQHHERRREVRAGPVARSRVQHNVVHLRAGPYKRTE